MKVLERYIKWEHSVKPGQRKFRANRGASDDGVRWVMSVSREQLGV